uniref:Uncharacterized protein n=1 Tax=Erpetoichthys calabaricus TaxID=27687 RepID=A0A8C4X6X0_ERPCA
LSSFHILDSKNGVHNFYADHKLSEKDMWLLVQCPGKCSLKIFIKYSSDTAVRLCLSTQDISKI